MGKISLCKHENPQALPEATRHRSRRLLRSQETYGGTGNFAIPDAPSGEIFTNISPSMWQFFCRYDAFPLMQVNNPYMEHLVLILMAFYKNPHDSTGHILD